MTLGRDAGSEKGQDSQKRRDIEWEKTDAPLKCSRKKRNMKKSSKQTQPEYSIYKIIAEHINAEQINAEKER